MLNLILKVKIYDTISFNTLDVNYDVRLQIIHKNDYTTS